MASTLRRAVATAGAAALIAGAVIVAAPSAQADGDYYGTWTLTTVKLDSQKQKCEGPDDGSGICPGGKTLTLKSNYRYKASAFVAQIMFLRAEGDGKGSFVTPVFPGTGDQALVLEGDATGIAPLGSAWQVVLKDKRSGSPTKMILTLQTGFFEIGLVFQRDAN
jgi:hypothetical protein